MAYVVLKNGKHVDVTWDKALGCYVYSSGKPTNLEVVRGGGGRSGGGRARGYGTGNARNTRNGASPSPDAGAVRNYDEQVLGLYCAGALSRAFAVGGLDSPTEEQTWERIRLAHGWTTENGVSSTRLSTLRAAFMAGFKADDAQKLAKCLLVTMRALSGILDVLKFIYELFGGSKMGAAVSAAFITFGGLVSGDSGFPTGVSALAAALKSYGNDDAVRKDDADGFSNRE